MPLTSSPSARLAALTTHLSPSPTAAAPEPAPATSSSSTSSMPPTRAPVTCHVLDTLTGSPGAGIPVSMRLLSPQPASTPLVYSGVTNADGRVPFWSASSSPSPASAQDRAQDMQRLFESIPHGEEMLWLARFELRQYWAARGVEKPFFPDAEIRFLTSGFGGVVVEGEAAEKGHWHVPLLVGPYSYTTYRGS